MWGFYNPHVQVGALHSLDERLCNIAFTSGGCPAIHAACKGRLAWYSPAAVRADIS
jgi:hypothetical protein